ncbi:MAG: hypothetical protein JWO58_2119 [Chitinophagaceae bacterium]|nr:hypothetical protein [Chitinophagaceae bacterium]
MFMHVIERIKAPTPKFFRVLRTFGLGIVATGTVLMAAPATLPAMVVSLGGYLGVAGGVLSAVSQTTVETDNQEYHVSASGH